MMAAPAASNVTSFTLGESFRSFEELEVKVEMFKKDNFIELWKRDARRIAAARRRGINHPLSASLKYYEVKYCCIHGGQAFKPRGKGKRLTA